MKLKQTKEDSIFDRVNYILLTFALLIFLYPIYFVVIASISDPNLVTNGEVLFIPKQMSFEGFKQIFNYSKIWVGYRNTIMYTIIGTFVNVILTVVTAYPLSQDDLKGRKYLMFYFVVIMYFNGGIVPTYMLVQDLGILNTPLAIIFVNALAVWNLIIVISYFKTNLPNELRDAAEVDGCNHIIFFIKIVLPLSTPILAVMSVYYGLIHWNDYFKALLYLSNENLYPLQLVLREILASSQLSNDTLALIGSDNVQDAASRAEKIKYGIIVVSIIPVFIGYLFTQKYFVKGMMIGSVKG